MNRGALRIGPGCGGGGGGGGCGGAHPRGGGGGRPGARPRRRRAAVEFFEQDALGPPLPGGYDVVACSLFLHHLDEPDAVKLLARMAEATERLVLVNDLVRSRLGWMLAYFGTRLLTRSRIVHVDGPRSVEGAFTPAEALRLAKSAGLAGARVSRHWPERFMLRWTKDV
jgi:2-polyprenyl-3-methyl-5-hydroxy-6-metoxy-1,4-benzoquinol methylase